MSGIAQNEHIELPSDAVQPARRSDEADECCVCVAVHVRPLIDSEVLEGCQSCLTTFAKQPEVGFTCFPEYVHFPQQLAAWPCITIELLFFELVGTHFAAHVSYVMLACTMLCAQPWPWPWICSQLGDSS